jgi:hypothetical protein
MCLLSVYCLGVGNQYFKRNPAESFLDSQFSWDSVTLGSDYMMTKMYSHCQSEASISSRLIMHAFNSYDIFVDCINYLCFN